MSEERPSGPGICWIGQVFSLLGCAMRGLGLAKLILPAHSPAEVPAAPPAVLTAEEGTAAPTTGEAPPSGAQESRPAPVTGVVI